LPSINCVLTVHDPRTFSVALEDSNTGRTLSYDHANAANLKSGRIPLEERVGDEEGWTPDEIQTFRGTFQPNTAPWSAGDLEKLVALAMAVLNTAKGHDNAAVLAGISKLQSHLAQAFEGGPPSAPDLANAIREFLFLLLQPSVALIHRPDFDSYMKQVKDIGTV